MSNCRICGHEAKSGVVVHADCLRERTIPVMARGATRFDRLAHSLLASKCDGTDYLSRPVGVKCAHCGEDLWVCYCESRVYAVECKKCGIKAITKARNPFEAAIKTFGQPIRSTKPQVTDAETHAPNAVALQWAETAENGGASER